MRKAVLTLSTILLFAVLGSAQTVDEIIAKNIEAKGGMAKLKAIQTLKLTGMADMGGMQAGFVRIAKRPAKIRMDISVQGMSMIQAYDGQNGWQVVPFTGKKDPEPMAADDLKLMVQQADIDGPLMDYKQKGHKVELIGKEKIEGTDAWHLKLTLKDGDVSNIYLDADSFLEIKTVGKSMRRGAEVESEVSFGDYKEESGMMLFHSMEIKTPGTPGTQKITFTKVEVNHPEDDAEFKMPAVTPAPAGDAKKPESGKAPPQQ
jgi:outer membrane lipoprotein-sorting protein